MNEWKQEVIINASEQREHGRIKNQIKEELKTLNKECFYTKEWNKIKYDMVTVKQYLNSLKEKKNWKELTSKNSSAVIMAIQIALFSEGYRFWKIDWILWDRTVSAIKSFQKRNGLSIGIYWNSMPWTIDKLVKKLEEKEKWKEEVVEWNDISNQDSSQIASWNNDKDNSVKISGNEKDKEEILETAISPEVQTIIDSHWWHIESLKNLTKITYAEAAALAEHGRSYLDLSGIENIKPSTLKVLLYWKNEWIKKVNWWLNLWIKDLTLENAKVIGWVKENGEKDGCVVKLTFSKLKSLSPEIAWCLSWSYWGFSFEWLEYISPESINALSNKNGTKEFTFWWIKNLDEDVAKAFSDFPWNSYMTGVKKINKEVSKQLIEKNTWRIFLNWLELPLEQETIENLSRCTNVNLHWDVLEAVDRLKHPEKYNN